MIIIVDHAGLVDIQDIPKNLKIEVRDYDSDSCYLDEDVTKQVDSHGDEYFRYDWE